MEVIGRYLARHFFIFISWINHEYRKETDWMHSRKKLTPSERTNVNYNVNNYPVSET
jgi:hypothetical protein